MLTAETDDAYLYEYADLLTTPVKSKPHSDNKVEELFHVPPTATKKQRDLSKSLPVHSRKARIYRRPMVNDGESQDSYLSLGESLLRDLRSLALQEDEVDLQVEIQSIAESVESAENRSLAESFLTQSSTGFVGSSEAAQERRLYQRQKQIDYGKNTIGYARYSSLVPVQNRNRQDPITPDKSSKCSKRSWDGLVRNWRRKLHFWDPPEEEFWYDERTTEMGTQTYE